MPALTTFLLAASASAAAQEGLDLLRFRPALDAPSMVTTPDSQVGAPWTAGGALMASYADDPLVLRSEDSLAEQEALVSNLSTVDASAWVNLPRVRLGLSMPFVVAATGLASDASRVVGDLEIQAAPELVRRDRHGLGLGVVGALRVPTGDPASWTGDGRASGRLGVVGTAQLGPVGLAGQVGGRTGTGAEVDGWTWGPSLDLGLGANLAVSDALAFSLEASGAHVLAESAAEATPFEGLAAAHVRPAGELVLTAGGGTGLSRGLGAPDFRLFAGVGWHPGPRPQVELEPEPVAEQHPAALTGRLEIRVTDDQGRPVSATVLATAADGSATQLHADNGLALATVLPGEWKLQVQAEGHRPSSALVRLDAGSLATATVALAPWSVEVSADRLVLPDRIHFAFDSDVIQPGSYALLQEVAELLDSRPELSRIAVMGHADATGSRSYNLDLSARRAEAVVQWLIAAGVEPDRLDAHAFGEELPLQTGQSDQDQAMNRRVELLIVQRAASL